MRWHSHIDGEKEIVRRFLMHPVTIAGETRWLEWAHIEREYKLSVWPGGCALVAYNLRFADEGKSGKIEPPIFVGFPPPPIPTGPDMSGMTKR